jgi:uncharacterized protein YfaS (alpha-2-macroglobulin family)
VTLPDNLTTWRLTARAVTVDTSVGEARVKIVTQQSIVVQPVLPRTLTAGDRVELSAIVHNYTDAPQTLVVGLQAKSLQVTGPLTQVVSLAAKAQSVVGWTATAGEAFGCARSQHRRRRFFGRVHDHSEAAG